MACAGVQPPVTVDRLAKYHMPRARQFLAEGRPEQSLVELQEEVSPNMKYVKSQLERRYSLRRGATGLESLEWFVHAARLVLVMWYRVIVFSDDSSTTTCYMCWLELIARLCWQPYTSCVSAYPTHHHDSLEAQQRNRQTAQGAWLQAVQHLFIYELVCMP